MIDQYPNWNEADAEKQDRNERGDDGASYHEVRPVLERDAASAVEARLRYLEHCRKNPGNRRTAGKLWRAWVEAVARPGGARRV